MQAKITFKYFHPDDVEKYSFYRIPKQLFTLEPFKGLSSDAKILYALMLDRVSLSLKNNWIDDDNRVYIYFSVEDVMEQLGCGKNKAIKCLKELDVETGIGLIRKRRQGLGKTNIIYVKTFQAEKRQTSGSSDDKLLEVCKEESNNCVCSYLGLETGDYSYPYIAGWAADRPRNVLQESMDMIRTTSGQIIDQMLEVFKEHDLIKGQDLDVDQINDFYEIYQIDPSGKARDQMFLGYDYLESHGLSVKAEDYRSVYHGDLKEGMTLEGIYEKFNLYRPEDFEGHSLSVGDIVLMSTSGKRQAFFVDTIGFKEISGFDKGAELIHDVKKKQTISKDRKTNKYDARREAVLCR